MNIARLYFCLLQEFFLFVGKLPEFFEMSVELGEKFGESRLSFYLTLAFFLLFSKYEYTVFADCF